MSGTEPRSGGEVLDVATGHTVDFVVDSVGVAGGGRVLEIGAGAGRLARALRERGYEVVAIDSDRSAVDEARARGVDARLGIWPDSALDERFEMVLFSRSLHHVADLDGAVDGTRDHLDPGGVILVEDFAYLDVAPELVHWFVGELGRIGEAGVEIGKGLPRALVAADDPVAAWRRAHGHDLHSPAAMEASLGRRAVVDSTQAPYLYRYLDSMEVDAATLASLQRRILEGEVAFAEQRSVDMLGRRWVAHPTTGGRTPG